MTFAEFFKYMCWVSSALAVVCAAWIPVCMWITDHSSNPYAGVTGGIGIGLGVVGAIVFIIMALVAKTISNMWG